MVRTPKTSAKGDARCAPAFHILRQFIIHALAKEGVPTVEIARRLGHVRSFVIKQTTITLKPRTPLERRILKLAEVHGAMLKRAGLLGLTAGVDIETVLAGGERPKLGTLASRRAASKTTKTKRARKRSKPNAKDLTPPLPAAKLLDDTPNEPPNAEMLV